MDAPQANFSQLDALLEQALALAEPARFEFLAGLGPVERAQVQELLAMAEAVTLEDVAQQVGAAVDTALAASQDSHRGGQVAGRWRLQRELGSGGMGQVFFATRVEATQEDLGGSGGHRSDYVQQAAVKVLWSHRAGTEAMARFFRERRILARLEHPGLARFLDGGFLADGRPWFAMEYVDGVDLVSYASKRSLRERLRLFVEVCASVAYAHERLIVHRDIKPQNILVDATGRTRLLDFGVASVLGDVGEETLTSTRGSPMTLQYASPEQVSGDVITAASDIYQLGLVLYQLLTGKRAYELNAQSLREALAIIAEQTPPPPSRANAEVSGDLDAIVRTALHKQPDSRYPSVSSLADDVQRYLDGLPVKALPPSPWYIARRFIQRNAVLVVMALLAVGTLVGATLVSIDAARDAEREAARSAVSQQILADVFTKADPFGASGADVTLADALSRAQPEIERKIAGDERLRWEVNRTLASIYESLGLTDQEAAAYQSMLAAAEQLPDLDAAQQLAAIAGYGSTLARTNPAQAIEFFDAHLPIEPLDPAAAPQWLAAQYAYVGSLNRLRRFDDVAAGTARMRRVIERYGADARTQGQLHQLQAGVARREGDAAVELEHWHAAVQHAREGNHSSAVAVSLGNLGIALGRHGQPEAAEQAFREAVALYAAAEHEDMYLAGILRGYAGLLFRTGRTQQAVTTTQRALDMLDPSAHAYAHLVAGLNLAYYTFSGWDPVATWEAFRTGVAPTLAAFPDDAGIAERYRGLFAKALLFAGDWRGAARALQVSAACDSEVEALPAVEAALARYEDPVEDEQRTSLWRDLAAYAGAEPGGAQHERLFTRLWRNYSEQLPPFFDVQDRWRLLEGLRVNAGSRPLPARAVADLARLRELQQHSAAALASAGGMRETLRNHIAVGSEVSPDVCEPRT